MTRPHPDRVRRVACIGTGTIGAGWCAYFLARGFDVTASDPAPDAGAVLEQLIADAWPALERLGLAPGARRDRLRYTPDLANAVEDAEFIQESAPDRESLKIDLFAQIGRVCPPGTIIASSSSSFLPTRLAASCPVPERCIVGHPFVPSYLVPLVEVVDGEHTTSEVLDWAVAFYAGIGKRPLRLKREIDSYVANRLQKVVFDEAERLVASGVCDYPDIDTAMVYGPGMRWAFAGPMLCYHLGGGKGGVRHMIDHFGWLGVPGSEQALIEAVERCWGVQSMRTLERWRDENLLTMLHGLKRLPED